MDASFFGIEIIEEIRVLIEDDEDNSIENRISRNRTATQFGRARQKQTLASVLLGANLSRSASQIHKNSDKAQDKT